MKSDLKRELLKLKSSSSTVPLTQNQKEKIAKDLTNATYNISSFNPSVRYEVIKNSVEFRESLPLIDLLSMKLHFMSTEAIRKLSVVECNTPDLVNIRGINSIKMGSTEKDLRCGTCSLNKGECTGHIGHIELVKPFIHPLALDYSKIVLECICEECGNVALPESSKKFFLALKNKPTFKKIKDIANLASSSDVCPNTSKIDPTTNKPICTNKIPKNKVKYEILKIMSGNLIKKKIEYSKLNKIQEVNIYAEELKEIFKRISPYDLSVLGFANGATPVNFILEVLPVIPERDRPSTILKNNCRIDDITQVYKDIIKANQSLEKELINTGRDGGDIHKQDEYQRKLWDNIKYLMNNNIGIKKIGRGSNAVAKTLNHKLSGKKGYCRKGAQTKRVNYSGRSVIGGAECEFGWVILPYSFLSGNNVPMTIPEKVFEMNLERIRNMEKEGQIYKVNKGGIMKEFIYDRFTKIQMAARNRLPNVDSDSKEKTFSRSENDRVSPIRSSGIDIGDTVYRYATLGDDVYINRQPTLHRHSMIGVRTIFHKNKPNVQIHMSYTHPLNADFDGDEINVHFPQTLTARAELRHLLNATKQIISVERSTPIMFLLFNCPTSAYLISQDLKSYELINEQEEMDLIEYFQLFNGNENNNKQFESYVNRLKKYNIPRRTPQAIFSLLFPSNFNYKNKIREGIYIQGTLDKGDVSNSIIHALYMKYGSAVTSRFISKGQFILDFFLERRGFTISLQDFMLKDYYNVKQDFKKKIDDIRSKVIKRENKPTLSEIEKKHKAQEIFDFVTKPIDDEFGKMISNMDKEKDNNFVTMVNSKAKGKLRNITRVMGVVGQQTVNGDRPTRTMYGNRTIPYFDVGDTSLESRGFSTNGFMDGLTPAAFFFQAQESRIGLLNTALETAEVGALTKRISKVMENEMVNYDGGIIDAKGNYTDLSYDDGFDRSQLIQVDFNSTGGIYMPFDIRMILTDLDLLNLN